MRDFFVVSDIHGDIDSLRKLLLKAGVINEDDERTDEVEAREFVAESKGVNEPRAEFWSRPENQRSFNVISIGDLLNGTVEDINHDEECILKAREWFDYLILGNHESPYLFRESIFSGSYEAPHIRSLYNTFRREGFVVPAVMIGNTLLTHAGVMEYFGFETAEEAFDAIYDVWENYNEYETGWNEDGTTEHKFVFFNGQVEIPKSLLLNAIGPHRGGDAPFGGLLWSDWNEKKNANFNQIVGHTPMPVGPVKTEYFNTGVFTVNIDTGCKGGGVPTGVWLDEEGQITEVVTVSVPGAETVTA